MEFLLRTPFLPFKIREEMGISNVRLISRIIKALIKNLLKFIDKRFPTSHQTGKSFHIMRYIESIVPGTTFMKTGIRFEIFSLPRIERCIELSIRQNGAESAEFFAIIMFITQRTIIKKTRILFLAQSICQQGKRIIRNVILQCMRDRIIILFTQRNISQWHIIIIIRPQQILGTGQSGRFIHSFISQIDIKIA